MAKQVAPAARPEPQHRPDTEFESAKLAAARNAQEDAYIAWSHTYTGSADPREAYKTQLAIAASEAKAAATPAIVKPDAAKVRYVREVLNDAVEQAARFRSTELTADERTDLINKVMQGVSTPKATTDAIREHVARLVDLVVDTSEVGVAREQARGNAYAIAGKMSRTFEVPSDTQSPDEQAATLAAIPRA
jgi:hypothetical protein